MLKKVLHEMVYYYEDAVKNFDQFMNVLSELEEEYKKNNIDMWQGWTSSNDLSHIYGKTKSFGLYDIEKMPDVYKEKSLFIYKSVMESFYDVCKDYALSIGDKDEPNLFPTFNIKKYDTGLGMGSHFDQLDGDKTLRYSLVMYLNDDHDGGEISFRLSDYETASSTQMPELDYDVAIANNNIDFAVKPKAGSIIIFPSSAPYYHTAHLVKSGFKYMVPGHWIHNDMPEHESM